MKPDSIRQALASAVVAATPSCSRMFANVQEGSAPTRNGKTNPLPRADAAAVVSTSPARSPATGNVARDNASNGHPGCSGMFTNVQEDSAKSRNDKTKPNGPRSPLTSRQVATAWLLALGRSGRAAAAEVGVEEHTVSRWRRVPAFAAEVRRQQELVLAEQVRQRRAEAVDGYAAVAERIARKYGVRR